MFFSWLDTRAAKSFGMLLAHFYISRLPVNCDLTAKQFTVKTNQVLGEMGKQVIHFKQKNKLNTYKIAQMGNTFKWELKDAGYDDAYVNKLTEWLVAQSR